MTVSSNANLLLRLIAMLCMSVTIPTFGVETWAQTGSLLTKRAYHTATLLNSGKVLVTGGSSSSIGLLGSCEVYDPVSGTWALTGSLINPRGSHSATLLSSGKVLVEGGYGLNGLPLTAAEIYDPGTGAWSSAGLLPFTYPKDPGPCKSILLTSGNVMAVGGQTATSQVYLSNCEIYNPTTNNWSSTGFLSNPRAKFQMVSLFSGNILVTGGQGAGDVYLSSSEIYNTNTGIWSMTGSMRSTRGLHAMITLPSGKVIVSGGFGIVPGSWDFFGTCEIFDPNSGTWTTSSSMQLKRCEHLASSLPSGKIIVSGGYNRDGDVSVCEIYDPASDLWKLTKSLAFPRYRNSATVLSSGKVLVVGGRSSSLNTEISNCELVEEVIDANKPPTVLNPATASPNPVTGKTTLLSVLGADDGGEANLTYTWATTGTPPAAVTFSANRTNTAKSSTATFSKAGSYTLQCTITDSGSLSVFSSVTVTVNQTATKIAVTPASANVVITKTRQYVAVLNDQFGLAMTTQPTITWGPASVTSGTLSSTGLFTANTTVGGPYTLTATGAGKSGTATVTVIAVPIVTTAAITGITNTSATSGGNVTFTGGSAITARGVCWSTTANPTIANTKTSNGTGTGIFTSSLTGLSPGTTYNVRAYATNSSGTAYGANVKFTTTGVAPFIIVIKTDNIIAVNSPKNMFTVPLYTNTAYNFMVDWGDSTSSVISGSTGGGSPDPLNPTHTYAIPGTYTVKISENVIGGFPHVFFGSVADNWKVMQISQWGNGTWSSMSYAFKGCKNMAITATDGALAKTDSVTDYAEAWNGCTSMTSFPIFNTAKGTNFTGTWGDCTGLTSFPLLNTAAATNFQRTWEWCSSLTSFPLLNTAQVTNFQYAWDHCSALTSFPQLNTGRGVVFTDAWSSCTKLTVFPTLNFSNMINGDWCFGNDPGYPETSVTLDVQSYSNILISLAAGNINNNVWFSGGLSRCNGAALIARDKLISHGWYIVDGNTAAPAPAPLMPTGNG
jgi:Galactose oxidase, central domain